MNDDQLYNGIENYGFGELPDTKEDLVEALEILQADIANISMQIEMRAELGYDSEWLKKAIGARAIKQKQRGILRGHKVWMTKDEKVDTPQQKITAVLKHLYESHQSAHKEAILICKKIDAQGEYL